MKIAVTGATGQLGQLVVAELKKKVSEEEIVALARSREKAAELGLGVEVREADYDRPETLEKALKGIDRLVMISASEVGKREPQHMNLLEAARKAGVKYIVYTSLLHADNSSLSLAPEHFATEKALKQSGIPHAILRNGWYTENYTNSIPAALGAGAFIGSAGEGKISSASRQDFAEAAVVAITSEDHQGKTYELAGDEAYTLSELAAEISRQSGKDIPYNNLPEEQYASILGQVGVPEPWNDHIANWDVSVSQGDIYDDSRQLSKLIGRPTTPMPQTVAEVVQKKQ